MNQDVPAYKDEPASSIEQLVNAAAVLADHGISAATRRAYANDWSHYTSWCATRGFSSLPTSPETVALYLADHWKDLAVATLQRRLATISARHRLEGLHVDLRHPAVAAVLRGVRRERGTAQKRAIALSPSDVRRMAAGCPGDLLGIRDRAVLLFGFASALRRSELAALDVGDLQFLPEGVRVTVRRSKCDQDGAGEVVAVARTATSTCPVSALQQWLLEGRIAEGRVFRGVTRGGQVLPSMSDKAVCRAIKRAASRVGLTADGMSGHSLRAGFATAAAMAGLEEREIARQTRHRSTVVRRYIREGNLFRKNLSREIGL